MNNMAIKIVSCGDIVNYNLNHKTMVNKRVLHVDVEAKICLVEWMPSTSVWLSFNQLKERTTILKADTPTPL